MAPKIKDNNRSHSTVVSNLDAGLKEAQKRILARGDLEHVSVEQQLKILNDLMSFPLGRHIFETRGANGYWTDYLISPTIKPDNSSVSYLEMFLLFQSPHVLAQRELFNTFQKTAQAKLTRDLTIASIPCGRMRDLLGLDFQHAKKTRLVGIDIDPDAILSAKQLASQLKVDQQVDFFLKDALELNYDCEFDIINSIGLNVYESDRSSVIDLYKRFYSALKPGGILFYRSPHLSSWIFKKLRLENRSDSPEHLTSRACFIL